MTTRRVRAAVLALVALLVLTSCGRIETVLAFGATAEGVDLSIVLDRPEKAIKASCAGKLTNDNRLAPPAGLPRPQDVSWLLGRGEPGKQVYLGWVVALEPRLNELRIGLVDEARSRGYDVDADQWRGRVLNVTYRGSAEVSITVQPFCRDRLALRYVVTSLRTPAPLLPLPDVAAARACPPVAMDAAPLTGDQVPLAFPPGAQTLRIGAEGDADVYTAVAPGDPDNAEQVRDGLLTGLAQQGFVAAALPFEAGRSLALVGGPRLGSLVVQPWCRGTLAVRYELLPSEDIESAAASAARPCTGRDDPEQLPETLPGDLSHPGQTVLYQRRASTFRSWKSITPVPGADAAKLAGEVATRLQANGAELTPVTAPEDLRAAKAKIGPSWVLVIVRPHCVDRVAEQYVVTP